MTVGTHRRVGVKIHTSRSMASTINTSHSESLFDLGAARPAAEKPSGQILGLIVMSH
jgi:hypothetical protein